MNKRFVEGDTDIILLIYSQIYFFLMESFIF